MFYLVSHLLIPIVMEINGPVHSCDVHQHCHALEQALIELVITCLNCTSLPDQRVPRHHECLN